LCNSEMVLPIDHAMFFISCEHYLRFKFKGDL